MKSILTLLVLISVSVTAVQGDPFLSVTTRNFDAMIEGSAKIANAVRPGSGDKFKKEFLKEIGNPGLVGVDRSRPWHHATFRRSDGRSSPSLWHAYYVPVYDFKAFKGALQEGGKFTGVKNLNIIRKSANHAVVITRYNSSAKPSAADRKRIVQWIRSAPTDPKHDFTVNFVMDDQARAISRLAITFAQSMFRQQMMPTAGNKKAAVPMPIPGAAEMLDVYFDLALMIVKGTGRIIFTLDVEEDRLVLRDRVVALPDSQLAGLLQPSTSDLGSLTQFFAADTPLAVAAHMTGDSYLRKLFMRAMEASSKMTGTEADDQVLEQTQALMDAMLPMSLAVAIDWDGLFTATGVYQFASANAPEIHKKLLDFSEEFMKKQVGSDGIYSEFKSRRNVRNSAGMSVDQLTMTLNRDNPVFTKQDRQVVSQIWPDDKLQFEYASKGQRLFYSMGQPVEQAASPAEKRADLAVKAADNSVLLGRINFISLLRQSLMLQRKRSKRTGRILEALDSKDAGVDVRVNLDGGIDGMASVPLKMLRELGKMIHSNTSK